MERNHPISLRKFIDLLPKGLIISDVEISPESREYSACSFQLNSKAVLFRQAKITPKKPGQFVSIWKRNDTGITQPFDQTDAIDLVIIFCASANKFGAFIFPKAVLQEKRIFTANGIEGKRGIRVYPTWDLADNQQSKKTQTWQSKYFIAFTELAQDQLIEKLLEA